PQATRLYPGGPVAPSELLHDALAEPAGIDPEGLADALEIEHVGAGLAAQPMKCFSTQRRGPPPARVRVLHQRPTPSREHVQQPAPLAFGGTSPPVYRIISQRDVAARSRKRLVDRRSRQSRRCPDARMCLHAAFPASDTILRTTGECGRTPKKM